MPITYDYAQNTNKITYTKYNGLGGYCPSTTKKAQASTFIM